MATPQAPGYQGVTQETSRVLKRGQLEYFVFNFYYDQANTQAVMPIDPQQYPNFRILNPQGEIIQQGTAIPGSTPGMWKVGWVVPRNAQLSNVNKRYKIQTVMVDSDLRQFETSFDFDIVEPAIPAQAPELQQRVVFVGDPLRLKFVNTVQPEFLQVRIVPRGSDCSPIHVAKLPVPGAPESPSDLKMAEVNNAFVYYTDIPYFPMEGEYSAIWNVRDFTESAIESEHQAIDVISTSSMHLVKSIRMLIDKLQKKLGIVYAYTVEDFVEYLRRGVGFVNQEFPPTYYGLGNVPSPMENFVIYAAAWHGLTAQRLTYAETNLDFSGQTVTLGYNPGADLDGIISNFATILEKIAASKLQLVRQASAAANGAGYLSTRPLRNRSALVYKTQNYSGGANNLHLLSHLAQYGIVFDT